MDYIENTQSYNNTSSQHEMFDKYISSHHPHDRNISEIYNHYQFHPTINNNIRPSHNSNVHKLSSGNKYREQAIKNSSDSVLNHTLDFDPEINQRPCNLQSDRGLFVSVEQEYGIQGLNMTDRHSPTTKVDESQEAPSSDESEDGDLVAQQMYPWMKSQVGKLYQ